VLRPPQEFSIEQKEIEEDGDEKRFTEEDK